LPAYSLTKKPALFPSPENMPGPGPYYTCLVAMSDLDGFPFDYALYFSPDHDPGEGGIWLYVCNGNPLEPANWLSYEDAVSAGHFDHIPDKAHANPIHLDNVQGTGHTETPHANVVDGVLHMTYHKNGLEGTQRTMLATSTDGVNMKRLNGDNDSVVLRYDQKADPGDGHTGYFRWSANPFPGIAQKWIGYSLHGGSDNYYSALWASDDAIHWERLEILTPIEGLAVDQDDMILIWHEIDPSSIRPIGNGEFVAITGVGNRASGGVERITELYEIFLAEDGRTLTRQSRKILPVGPDGSPDTEELSSPTSVIIDGTTHLIYVGAAEKGDVNTVLGATAVFDTSDLPPQLPGPSKRRHIHTRPLNAATPPMAVNPASKSDIPLLVRMNREMVEDMGAPNWTDDRYEARFDAWIKGGHWHVDLFEQDGEIVGYAVHQRRQDHFEKSKGVTHVRHFFIERNRRRIGVGRTAFEALVEQRGNRAQSITLDVLPSTPDAMGFWKKLGFDTYYTVLKRTT
jgi:GNAT superfamily N-acetyltransferase